MPAGRRLPLHIDVMRVGQNDPVSTVPTGAEHSSGAFCGIANFNFRELSTSMPALQPRSHERQGLVRLVKLLTHPV